MDSAPHMNSTRITTSSYSPAVRVAALTFGIALASLTIIAALPNGTDLDRQHLGILGALAVAFMLSERLIFHIEARSEANSYSPTEIGLAIGVAFVFPS